MQFLFLKPHISQKFLRPSKKEEKIYDVEKDDDYVPKKMGEIPKAIAASSPQLPPLPSKRQSSPKYLPENKASFSGSQASKASNEQSGSQIEQQHLLKASKMSEFVQISQMSIASTATKEQPKAIGMEMGQVVGVSIAAEDTSRQDDNRGRTGRASLPRRLSRAHSRSKSSELKKMFVPVPIALSKERADVQEQHFEIPEAKYHQVPSEPTLPLVSAEQAKLEAE